ncbi:hypothetical protein NVV93_16280 [Pseudomonas sp. LS44]|uniref:hypothetical protein n=1 Tax=Pseudomonas sp. LS44 TaxID=1357074 RepID=UPI00215ADD68|nr:hypothetical protein [Pseudomonas sp. LS44]UVE17125.1 hypothetical protein NVV93_16280 [Pseudomonas sp. LS44]
MELTFQVQPGKVPVRAMPAAHEELDQSSRLQEHALYPGFQGAIEIRGEIVEDEEQWFAQAVEFSQQRVVVVVNIQCSRQVRTKLLSGCWLPI